MTALNNNYATSMANFAEENFAEAASVAQFNAAAGVDYIAFALFLLNGGYQDALTEIDARPIFIWGNEDTGNTTGWSLRIQPGGAPLAGIAQDPVLVARSGNGAGFDLAQLPLSQLGVGLGVSSGYVERLIFATVGFHDNGVNRQVVLSVNGCVADSQAASAYAASAVAPRLGLAPDGADEAIGLEVLGCGYIRGAGLMEPQGTGLSANAFRSARADYGTGFLLDASGIDWVHRWQSPAPSTGSLFSKSAQGAFLAQLPPVPTASLQDLGSSGVQNQAAGLSEAGIALNITGTLRVDQRRNPDWYAGGGGGFLGAPA